MELFSLEPPPRGLEKGSSAMVHAGFCSFRSFGGLLLGAVGQSAALVECHHHTSLPPPLALWAASGAAPQRCPPPPSKHWAVLCHKSLQCGAVPTNAPRFGLPPGAICSGTIANGAHLQSKGRRDVHWDNPEIDGRFLTRC